MDFWPEDIFDFQRQRKINLKKCPELKVYRVRRVERRAQSEEKKKTKPV